MSSRILFALGRQWARMKKDGRHDHQLRMLELGIENAYRGRH